MEFKNKFNIDSLIILNSNAINFDEGKYIANQYYRRVEPKNNNFDECSDAFHKSILESSAELRRRLYLMVIYDFDFVINCLFSKYFYLVKEPVKLGRHFDDSDWKEILEFYYLVLLDNRIRTSCAIENINIENHKGMLELRKIYPSFFCDRKYKMGTQFNEYKILYDIVTSLIDECVKQEVILKAKNINIYRSEYKLVVEEKKEKIRSLIDSDFYCDTNIKKIEFNNSEFNIYLDMAHEQLRRQGTEEQYENIKSTIEIINRIVRINKKKIKSYNKKRS